VSEGIRLDGSSRAEFKVGATVLVALFILVAGLLWLKGFRLERSRYTQEVWFPNIGTLSVGDPVSISGVNKGKVSAIDLHDGGVKVGIQLANDVVLRADAVFTIKNVGLMGERFIDVRTGSLSDVLPTGVIARGEYDTGIPEVMGLMGRMTEDVRDLVTAVRSTIGADTTLQRIAAITASLEQVARQTSDMIQRNQTGIDHAVADFGAAAKGLRSTVQDNQSVISQSVHRIDSASAKLSSFADRLDSLATSAHQVVSDFQNGDGTLSRLVHDDQLLRRWEATALEIDELVRDIRSNPKKYLKVDVRLF
jgi:phospholipid/cholesterol/gamma-HCH transport system substrate-binding protein